MSGGSLEGCSKKDRLVVVVVVVVVVKDYENYLVAFSQYISGLQIILQPMLKFGTDQPIRGKFRCEQ